MPLKKVVSVVTIIAADGNFYWHPKVGRSKGNFASLRQLVNDPKSVIKI